MSAYRLVWFQHLHKAAGTYVIRRAMANGETFWATHENGNPVDGSEVIPLWKMEGQELTDFIDRCEADGVTFVACEWGGADFSTLAEDERVTLLTCLRNPINRLISNYNYDHYWMWTKASDYAGYMAEGNLHSSPEYYTRIFSRNNEVTTEVNEESLRIAQNNLKVFDHVIIAEDGMDVLNTLGWPNESDTTHPTFGDKKRAMILLVKLRIRRWINYRKGVKHLPPESMDIEGMNRLDMKLYSSLRK